MKKTVSLILCFLLAAATICGGMSFAASASTPADGEVLYENDFSDGLLSGFRVVSGDARRVYAEDGFLYLDADGIELLRVMLPESLDSYGNYEITVKATLQNPRDTGRWNSVVYRAQNGDYPYYQMCVRSNATATNGVEFALRTEANAWNVITTDSYSEAIDPDTLYTYTVRACGENVTESINGTTVIDTDNAGSYLTGGIGLQANFSKMKVDSIKVTYVAADEQAPEPQFVELAQPDTGIIGGYTFSQVVASQAELDAVVSAEVKPANVIFYVNSDLKVTDSAFANPTISLSDAVSALREQIMPTVYIGDAATATALAAYLNDSKLQDVFVMSADRELVKTIRAACKICRGALDFTSAYKGKDSVTTDELDGIRAATNAANATVAVIPSNIATQANVKYLYDRVLTVWVNSTFPVTTVTQAFKLLAAGGSGAITDNTALLYKVTKEYMSGNKLLRSPLNVGHRGIPTKAPENTVEGSLLAYELGADAIENDIYITTDGVIVVMHDGNTSRTFNGSLDLESCTLEQLKALTCITSDSDYKDCKIPTLEEYYQAFKGKDTMLFIEIKSSKAEIITAFKELTEKYGMERQVNVISFNAAQLKRLKTAYPEMSCGYLCGWSASGSTGAKQEQSILKTIQTLSSTYNPSYPGYTSEFAQNANMRGTLTFPWTVDDKNVYIDLFMQGYNGMTTNNCTLAAKWAKTLTTTAKDTELLPGSTYTISATKTLYNRSASDVSSDVRVIILEGKELVTVDGTTLKLADTEGTVSYALEITQKLSSAKSYTLYTEPVTLTIANQKEETTVSDTTSSPAADTSKADSTTAGNESSGNTTVIIIVCVIVAVIIAAVVVVIVKKKK